jgi:hypothetical protein
MMRAYRLLGGSLVAAVAFAACSDSQPTTPESDASALNRAGAACQISDNAVTQTRTVSGACTNLAVRVPDGWTLSHVGPAASNEIIAQSITAIENPDAAYIAATDVIDISGIADFTNLTSITDGTQTVSFDLTMNKRSVPASWGTWGSPPFTEGNTPHILYTQGADALEMTLSVPSGIFGFELNPNPFAVHTYTAQFYSGAELVGSITRDISGDAGARLLAAQTNGPLFDRVVVTGTADFAIARVRYGEGEPSEIIPVDIHNVYSGMPAQDPGIISLDDDYVFVEILNIEQYIPRMASASNVRIGDTFEDGTPAFDFQIVDINQDGNRDIRVWFRVDDLVDDGNLSLQTQQVTVWGWDAANDDMYRGTFNVRVIQPPNGVLWNNGGMITHPGAGAGGADVSMASVIGGTSTAGSNARLVPPAGPHFRIGDDFTVPAGGWTVGSVHTHAYETGGPPTWSGANLNIRSGSVDGPIVATATTTTWVWTGIYRVFNGAANIGNTQRPVYRLDFDFGSLNLAPGTYWIDWQVQGGVSGWAPYVMEPDPTGGINTTTVLENGRQMFNAAGEWQPLLAEPGAETPFIVLAPGATAPPPSGTPVVSRPTPQAPDYHLQQRDAAGS